MNRHPATRALWIWVAVGVVAVALLTVRPFRADLDRGTLLAADGFILAVTAVTFGFVTVLAQHLSERYSRSLLIELTRGSVWQEAVIGQFLAAIGVFAVTLWRPDMTTGAASGVALVGSGVASWIAIIHLLGRFDAFTLIESLRKRCEDDLVTSLDKGATAIEASHSILGLLLGAAAQADVDVVDRGLAAWKSILSEYLRQTSITWSDPYLYWLSSRSHELIEQYSTESVGLVLPHIVNGIAGLGQTWAAYRNQINPEFDEGTVVFTVVLKSSVELSRKAARSTAAGEATHGIAQMARTCLEAGKPTTALIPIEALTEIGLTSPSLALHVSSRAAIDLANLVISIARSDGADALMYEMAAREAVAGIRKLLASCPTRMGPAHFLTGPLSDASIPLIFQELTKAAIAADSPSRSRGWHELAVTVGNLPLALFNDRPDVAAIGSWALDCAAQIALETVALNQVDQHLDVVRTIVDRTHTFAVTDDGRLKAADLLSVLLLTLYVASRPPAQGGLRDIVMASADRFESAAPDERRPFATVIRQLGATALHFHDDGMAAKMARIAPTQNSSLSQQLRSDADLFVRHGGLAQMNGCPGVQLPPTPIFHLHPDLQQRFLELAREHDDQPNEPDDA